jgi:hypothetical protein
MPVATRTTSFDNIKKKNSLKGGMSAKIENKRRKNLLDNE